MSFHTVAGLYLELLQVWVHLEDSPMALSEGDSPHDLLGANLDEGKTSPRCEVIPASRGLSFAALGHWPILLIRCAIRQT